MRALMGLFDSIKVFLLVRIGWRLFPGKFLEAIRRFEATEEDSSWHLLRGAQEASDPVQRAELFEQALEEVSHAEEFRSYYQARTGRKMARLKEEKKVLFGRGKRDPETWKLFAFCLIGESDAAERFQKIAGASDEPMLGRLLKRILADEQGHQAKAVDLLRGSDVGERERAAYLRSVRLKRFKEAWLRAGRQIADAVSTALLVLIYFIFSAPFVATARRRLGVRP